MMQKIHKNRTQTPGRILVQKFSYLEASAKFVSYFKYYILISLKTPLMFLKIRAEYEYKNLNSTLKFNEVSGQPTLIELNIKACYLSIKHNTIHKAFYYFLQYVPPYLMVLYINVWARVLYLLDHAMIQEKKYI